MSCPHLQGPNLLFTYRCSTLNVASLTFPPRLKRKPFNLMDCRLKVGRFASTEGIHQGEQLPGLLVKCMSPLTTCTTAPSTVLTTWLVILML